MNEKSDQDLERQLSEMLTDGEMQKEDREKDLSPKYEIRIQTQLDPIVEETLKYRSMAKEVDDRYDKYMDKAVKKDKPEDSGEEA